MISPVTDKRIIALALACVLAFAFVPDSIAAPKRSNGGTCDSTGTARRTGTDQATGEKLDCLFDTCTFTECSTSGGSISNCVQKTEYSNARDCKAAAKTGAKGSGVMSVPKNMQKLKAN